MLSKTFGHLGLIAVILVTQACTSTPPLSPSTILAKSKAHELQTDKLKKRKPNQPIDLLAESADTKKVDDQLASDFDQVFNVCQETIKGYENTSTALRWTSVVFSIVGALAGGVVVPLFVAAAPHANRAAIAAFGGVSGVTNTAQGSIKQAGLTPDQELQNRQSVSNAMAAAFQRYSDAAKERDPDQRYRDMETAIQNLRVACLTYSITNTAPTKTPIAAPVTPSTGATPGGTQAARTYYVKVTYTSANGGETLPSLERLQAVPMNNLLTVTSPVTVADATGYNVYVSTATDRETKQNATPITIGTIWQEPATGLIAGQAPPTVNTATTP